MPKLAAHLAIATTLCLLAAASPAAADTFRVNQFGDPKPGACNDAGCSLREAVIAANARGGRDTIVVPGEKAYRLTIRNKSETGDNTNKHGDLDIGGKVTIVHNGRGRARIDANGIDRAIDVLGLGRVTLVGIKVIGGRKPSDDGFGGGIRSVGKLTLIRSVVSGNRSPDDGGGIAFPENRGSLTLERSLVSGNRSGNDGGGISFDEEHRGRLVMKRSRIVGNRSADWGGGIITAVPVTITESTIAGNDSGDNAGGLSIEGPDEVSTIRSTTISGNEAAEYGGGLTVSSTSAATNVVNSTIAGNSADLNAGGIWAVNRVRLSSTTVARNNAGENGGGIYSESNNFKVVNSLIALNGAGFDGPDCFNEGGDFDSEGHNLLSDDGDCTGFDATGDSVSGNPKLGTLGAHGGPTKTIPLRAGSPAIGHAGKATSPKRDQRGRKRDAHPDSGAFER